MIRGILQTIALPFLVLLQLSERTRPWAQKQIENMKSEVAK